MLFLDAHSTLVRPRLARQGLLRRELEDHADAAARDLANDIHLDPARLPRLCEPRRGERDLLALRDRARRLVHHPDRAAQDIPQPPRGRVQARTVLHGRWAVSAAMLGHAAGGLRILGQARLGVQPELHRVDVLCYRALLAAQCAAGLGDEHELRVRHHRCRRCPFWAVVHARVSPSS